MSHVLYKLGRYAARHPWKVIAAWLFAAVLIIGMSTTFGRELGDSFEVPGLDSQEAIELLSTANSEQAGTTAQVVLAPLDESANFFDSAESRQDLAHVQQAVATAGQAVIFAGGTVIMVLASVTLLPAFLGVSREWINRLGIHRKKTTAATSTVLRMSTAPLRSKRPVVTHLTRVISTRSSARPLPSSS